MAADALGLLPDSWHQAAMICREIALTRFADLPITHWIPGAEELSGPQTSEQMEAAMNAAGWK